MLVWQGEKHCWLVWDIKGWLLGLGCGRGTLVMDQRKPRKMSCKVLEELWNGEPHHLIPAELCPEEKKLVLHKVKNLPARQEPGLCASSSHCKWDTWQLNLYLSPLRGALCLLLSTPSSQCKQPSSQPSVQPCPTSHWLSVNQSVSSLHAYLLIPNFPCLSSGSYSGFFPRLQEVAASRKDYEAELWINAKLLSLLTAALTTPALAGDMNVYVSII